MTDEVDPATLSQEERSARGLGALPSPRRIYDWPEIKRRYVEGVPHPDEGITEWPSLDAVAEHFEVGANRVREKAAKEGWRAQRTQWQASLEATRQQAKISKMSKEVENLDSSALDAAKLGIGLVKARLAVIAEKRELEGIDALEQQRLAAAVDLWHRVGLRAVGDPETHRLEITGAGGAPLEIATELRRDDADRLSGVLAVLQQAGVGDLFSRDEAEGLIIDVDEVEEP